MFFVPKYVILPSMEDPILDALKRATGYDRIYAQPSGYVIRVDFNCRSKVKGMQPSQNGFYLAHDEFDRIPISFLLETPSGTTWQYWTLNKRVHRENGPAYIQYNEKEKTLLRRYYYYGLGHREDGPWQEMYHGYTIDVDTFPGHYMETWGHAMVEWMVHGNITNKFTRWAELGAGQCYRHKRSRQLDSPEDFSPTFQVVGTNIKFIDWENYPEKDKVGVRPSVLGFKELHEDYSKGVLTSRWSDEMVGSWYYDGKLYTPAFEGEESWISKFTNSVEKNLLKSFDIWGGEIYQDDEAEFLVLTEFNSFIPTEKPE